MLFLLLFLLWDLRKPQHSGSKAMTFEAVFVTDSHEVYITEGLKDCFALTEDHVDTNVKVLEK